MMSRRSLAKAYVSLMDTYAAKDLSAAMAGIIASNKVNVELLVQDISAEILINKDILTGSLTTAHDLSDSQVGAIKKALLKSLDGKDIYMDIKVDPEIIGGFVAQTPAGTVDSSVITMLDKLEVA